MKLVVLAVLLGATLVARAQPERIILIRHAEKPDDTFNSNLSPVGLDRAERLVKWLTKGKVLGTNGVPTAIYASAPTHNGRSLRCVQTMEPIARALNVQIQTPYSALNYDRLARLILHDKSLQGKNVVICWVHEYIPEFTAAFGVKKPPQKWKDEDYDSAYVLTFPDGKAKLEVTRERLKKKS